MAWRNTKRSKPNRARPVRASWSAAAATCSISRSSSPIPTRASPSARAASARYGVSGPSIAQGYWKREELSRKTFQARLTDGRGPFLRTGDLGFLQGGELFVTGRLKDLIILRGVNHYPQDIEESAQAAHDDVAPSAGAAIVVGEENNEKLVLVQELVRRRGIDYTEVVEAIRKQLARNHEVAIEAIVLLKPAASPRPPRQDPTTRLPQRLLSGHPGGRQPLGRPRWARFQTAPRPRRRQREEGVAEALPSAADHDGHPPLRLRIVDEESVEPAAPPWRPAPVTGAPTDEGRPHREDRLRARPRGGPRAGRGP